MTRPYYENDETKAKEAQFANVLCAVWDAELYKMSYKNRIDYLMKCQGKAYAFIEVKCRTNPMKQYPTYMLSLDKWQAGLDLQRNTGKPFILAVQWTDKMAYLPCKEVIDKVDIGIGGRKDRNDEQDIEPVVLIPIEHFRLLEG